MGKNRDAPRRIDGRVRQRRERQSQEGIARQDGSCFAEFLVGRLACRAAGRRYRARAGRRESAE